MVSQGTEQQVEVLGSRTRYWEYGRPGASPLILTHGFRGDHHGLEALAVELVRLDPHQRILVPDLPGFGRTPPLPGREHTLEAYGVWLHDFTTAVCDGPNAVLGHSFGSLVVSAALAAGLAAPRTILVNPISAPALKGPKGFLTRLAVLYYRLGEWAPEPCARALLGNPVIVRMMSEVMSKTSDRELRSWIHDQHHQHFSDFSDTRTLLEAFQASISHTVPEFVAHFSMPTLLVAGDRDDITPLPRQLDLAHWITGSKLRIIPHVGHLIHYEATADAAAEILEFLRQGPGE